MYLGFISFTRSVSSVLPVKASPDLLSASPKSTSVCSKQRSQCSLMEWEACMHRTACPPTTEFKQYRTHPLWVTRLSAALCPYMGTQLPIWIIWQEQPCKRKPPAYLSNPFVECLNLTMHLCHPTESSLHSFHLLMARNFSLPWLQLGSHSELFSVSLPMTPFLFREQQKGINPA